MKKIVFLSGTRADWGKIKALVKEVDKDKRFCYKIFVCGMHLLDLYGKTFIEIYKDGFNEVFLAKTHKHQEKMDLALSDTIKQFSSFIKDFKPDLIIVHGDRLEALAGAIVGAFNNILVAHIEGGEISGTIDESIRHSISKLSHIHFVANSQAKSRLIQLGEKEDGIFIIGSPDIDLMLSPNLPSFKQVQDYYYQIKPFNQDYAIFIYHPVTTESSKLKHNITQVIRAILASNLNFIVIYPNNDLGSKTIIQALKKLENHQKFALFKSIKFEFFLTLLKNANFIIGNSSAGIREAPIYQIPCINIGSRQDGRFKQQESIISVKEDKKAILDAINQISKIKNKQQDFCFGKGESAEKFITILKDQNFWKINIQKKFVDIL